jgi:hypothetical protein
VLIKKLLPVRVFFSLEEETDSRILLDCLQKGLISDRALRSPQDNYTCSLVRHLQQTFLQHEFGYKS